jgi:hypothetical protein
MSEAVAAPSVRTAIIAVGWFIGALVARSLLALHLGVL